MAILNCEEASGFASTESKQSELLAPSSPLEAAEVEFLVAALARSGGLVFTRKVPFGDKEDAACFPTGDFSFSPSRSR